LFGVGVTFVALFTRCTFVVPRCCYVVVTLLLFAPVWLRLHLLFTLLLFDYIAFVVVVVVVVRCYVVGVVVHVVVVRCCWVLLWFTLHIHSVYVTLRLLLRCALYVVVTLRVYVERSGVC